MKYFYVILSHLFLILLIALTGSCSSEQDFSTNSSDKLAFSSDTVRFDTVFSTIGSSTRRFRIFNSNKKPLQISSIELGGGQNSPFSVVVDGTRGRQFSNVEIGGKDSLFVFVEVTIDPLNRNNPVLLSDSLIFQVNGNRQKVRFEAYGQDITIFKGKTIQSDTVLTGEKPFLIYDSLIVGSKGRLKLESGTRIYFHDKAFCRIDGQISAKGTSDSPVVFRGDRMDNMLPGLPYDLYTGEWGGVRITSGSFNNDMQYTQIRNGEYALQLDSASVSTPKISLMNCKFTNVTGTVLSSSSCNMTAYGCEFSNGGQNVVKLIGGVYEFVHCTMMNYFLFGSESPYAIHLCNYKLTHDGAWDFYPLKQALFRNCIFYGRRSTEINLDNKPKGYAVNTDFNYLFDYCLIKASGTDDDNFVSTLWNKDPKFRVVDDNYRFDLRLDSASVAINAGRYASGLLCPIDMNGHSRTSDGKPDLGAYEYVK